ncbi:hypothetical protein [Paenibacillus montanisoli]|uniref:hypothetical protein n=1 Tax=Paenibacillus montanisoli TaxID=2081970 RepID=UPI00140409D6|nr:hypothetical protein [Paenibacillus montanisoli]
MKKLFEAFVYGGLTGFLVIRIFFYENKGVMFAFAGLALLGVIGRTVIKRRG